ncbi:hypothetical protein BUM88_04325 [Acinetobacter calcoaceticus]|jgi:hypothetical protein|uniref:hypothetical protein n=1 Tax=Acinetobacter calcoaceticus TaxID=471 RepID=UPI0009AE17CF|nr:hypothetical protein [Acinetobacter calcoaceticus]AQZ80896.1 hypothetical protein BUM88_04325 [Acinetobacter calcoaceticus]
MGLNLDKLKAEARKDKAQEILAVESQKKIDEAVSRHREDLKSWFISLFPGENIEHNGYMETSVLFEGGIKVSLVFQLLVKSPDSNMLQAHNKVDFLFQKTQAGKITASTVFIDVTDYLNLEPTSKDYKYSYAIQDEKRNYKFSDLEQFLQYVIDK